MAPNSPLLRPSATTGADARADAATTAPATTSPATTAAARTTSGSGSARLVGIDLARALAVFGMYAVHVGPPSPAVAGPGGWLIALSEGRASALFALLAGFSVAIIAGRRTAKTGQDLRQARARILIRAAILLVVGTAMTMVVGDVVILAYYAVYFLLTLPLLRLRARALIVVAAVLAVVTPLVQLGITTLITPAFEQAVNRVDPLELLSGVGVLDLLVTGFYPAVTWITFVVAGMALARLDLTSTAVRIRAALTGLGLMVVGYAVPWTVAQIVGGAFKAAHDAPSGRAAEAFSSGDDALTGAPQAGGDWMSYFLAQPHSGSTFDLVGCIGIAILVVIGCLALVDSLPLVRRALTPVIALGTMSLTAYVGHFMIPQLFGMPFGSETSVVPLLVFMATATVFAFVWSRFFARGPLEELLHLATRPASRVR